MSNWKEKFELVRHNDSFQRVVNKSTKDVNAFILDWSRVSVNKTGYTANLGTLNEAGAMLVWSHFPAFSADSLDEVMNWIQHLAELNNDFID